MWWKELLEVLFFVFINEIVIAEGGDRNNDLEVLRKEMKQRKYLLRKQDDFDKKNGTWFLAAKTKDPFQLHHHKFTVNMMEGFSSITFISMDGRNSLKVGFNQGCSFIKQL